MMKHSWNRAVTTGIVIWFVASGLLTLPAITWASSIDENLAAIRAVGAEGQGHLSAVVAVKELSKRNSESLIPILKAFDHANPLSTNWLRGAFDAIAERTRNQDRKLPVLELEEFIGESGHSPEARRLAYDWLVQVDRSSSDRLIPGMLKDSSPEFRRDAVQRLIDLAEKSHSEKPSAEAIVLYREAMSGAIDDDQVKTIAKALRELGELVDLQKHFGFLVDWQLIGPFDNSEKKGFDVAYAPELRIDLTAKYPGKLSEVAWERHATTDEYGILNIAKQTAPHKGSVIYGFSTFELTKPQDVEIRLGTPNAWKLWINGDLLFGRDEYHRGTQLDQYRVKTTLKGGTNSILIKICQNEQTEEWAQDWKFQLRVCDSAGGAILPNPSSITAP